MMKITIKPSTIISTVAVTALLIGGGMLIFQKDSQGRPEAVNNVSIIDGKQVIEIKAKGGYQPRKSIAKANMPTIIRFDTSGTFDCSSSIRIPSLNISKSLPPSGSTTIELGVAKTGMLQGSCGMGMYPFEIDFQNL